MMHAKTAVADGRAHSTNLNIASWMGNWELDVVAEDEQFAQEMETKVRRLRSIEAGEQGRLLGARRFIGLILVSDRSPLCASLIDGEHCCPA